ncbi:hypothetical protein [Ereboglobus luteus]|uniref:hypothetical protein n=1 Tax=Ereboglobus luteus TaxID=1796921 RepID=UPI001260179C|nr:hypothetical protein [Ereboglobus luteus]
MDIHDILVKKDEYSILPQLPAKENSDFVRSSTITPQPRPRLTAELMARAQAPRPKAPPPAPSEAVEVDPDIVIMERMVVTSKPVRDIEIRIAEIDDLIARKTMLTVPTKLDEVLNHPRLFWGFFGGGSYKARADYAKSAIQQLEYQKKLLLIMRATVVREEYERYKAMAAEVKAEQRPAGPEPLGDPTSKVQSVSPSRAPASAEKTIVIPVSQQGGLSK